MSTAPDTSAAADEGLQPPRPPFIRRVRIRNYKSIAFCDVTLEPLTILVGRNASGKSNFLDALGFVRDVATVGAREAVREHGGRDAVLSRTGDNRTISIEIEGAFHDERAHGDWVTSLRLDIDIPERSFPRVVGEEFRLGNTAESGLWGYRVADGRVDQYSPLIHDPPRDWKPKDHPFLNVFIEINGFQGYSGYLASMLSYNFSPPRLRRPQLPDPGEYLAHDGRNLASVLRSIREADPFWFDRINAYLRAVTTDVQVVGIEPAGGYETIQFQVCGPDSDRPLTFPAESMSDGTLRVLAALTAAIQHFPPHGSPSLVAIEEPETALHPAAMQALVAALDEATLRTQILLTTHSPDLLEAEEVKPENVRVVQMIDGKTVIGPVDAAYVEIVGRELNTLGGLERDDQLGPDLDDMDRQLLLARNGSGAE